MFIQFKFSKNEFKNKRDFNYNNIQLAIFILHNMGIHNSKTTKII